MICEVYGTSTYSMAELSLALLANKANHKIVQRMRVLHKISKNPRIKKDIVVTDDYKKLDSKAVNFIVCSIAELSWLGCSKLKNLPINEAIAEALTRNEKINLAPVKISAVDYIHQIAKPSKLNHIQTELLRIQPYSLRKEATALMLQFFNGKLSVRQTELAMRKSSKLLRVWDLMKDNMELREAIARLSKESPEAISADTGIPTFELLFISKERKG